jgi:hypothetical protein
MALEVANHMKTAMLSLDLRRFDDLLGTLSWIFDKLKGEDTDKVSCQVFYDTVIESLPNDRAYRSMVRHAGHMDLNDTRVFFCKDMDFLFQSDDPGHGFHAPVTIQAKVGGCLLDSAQEVARLRTDVRFARKIPKALAVASQVRDGMRNRNPQGRPFLKVPRLCL